MPRFIKILFLTFFLINCKNVKVEKKIANQIFKVGDLNQQSSYTFLNKYISEKDIIILGEANHGDGKSFEIKSNIVEYLIKKKSFNTFAFEGRDFFDIEYINGRESMKNVFEDVFKEDWVRRWSPWGPSNEIEKLVNLFNNKNIPIKFIGLEPFTLNSYSSKKSFEYLKNQFESDTNNYNFYSSIDFDNLSKIRNEIINNPSTVSNEDFNFYVDTLEGYFFKLSKIRNKPESEFIMQVIENSITSAKIFKLNQIGDSDEIENEKVNLRDLQMAKNLIWFKTRNPNSKIIVWMANFHGAKKINLVKYENDTIKENRYDKLKVFGEHILEKYGNKVFSLAITSSRGKSKLPYNLPNIDELVIVAPKGSIEFELDLKNIEYGYLDFNSLRIKKHKLSVKNFNSLILGYFNQSGKWVYVYDGLLYIRENKTATPIK